MPALGKEFMLKTQYPYMDEYDQKKGIPQPPTELPYDPDCALIDLPAPREGAPQPVDLLDLINQRATVRQYDKTPISLAELSYLLWTTQGVKAETRRTVPSAGARHPFETLVLVNRVDGLEPGLYRFVASQHKLIRLNMPENIAEQIVEASLKQGQIKNSAVTLIWFAVGYRTVYRYGDRGYRYMHLDAGHVCQNLYLAAESIGCGVCAIAAFEDDKLNAVLGLDGVDQFVIYIGTVGKKKA